jgi:hypothetical protein
MHGNSGFSVNSHVRSFEIPLICMEITGSTSIPMYALLGSNKYAWNQQLLRHYQNPDHIRRNLSYPFLDSCIGDKKIQHNNM